MSKRTCKDYKKTETDKKIDRLIGQKIKEARLTRTILIKSAEPKFKGYDYTAYELINKKKLCTQTELAKAIGVTFQQIQKYEKGTNGLASTKLIKISKFFNKPLTYFTCAATELLGQYNPPDNNPKSLVPSNDTNWVNLKSDYN